MLLLYVTLPKSLSDAFTKYILSLKLFVLFFPSSYTMYTFFHQKNIFCKPSAFYSNRFICRLVYCWKSQRIFFIGAPLCLRELFTKEKDNKLIAGLNYVDIVKSYYDRAVSSTKEAASRDKKKGKSKTA